jgi:hypothetical protein
MGTIRTCHCLFAERFTGGANLPNSVVCFFLTSSSFDAFRAARKFPSQHFDSEKREIEDWTKPKFAICRIF